MKKVLRFGVEYLCPPIFNPDPDQMGHEELDDLQLPEPLKVQIQRWDARFQETFHDDYPPDSGFETSEDVISHNSEGLMLCEALQNHFGPEYLIEFHPLSLD
jgi:hypothetical protein